MSNISSLTLSELISAQNVILNLKGKSKDSVLQEMVDHLIEQKLIPSDLKDAILSSLRARESQMTTAMGFGLALPHATVTGLDRPTALFARSVAGIECAALDQQLVHLFFMILVPKEEYTTHLRTLSQAAKFFNKSTNREKLIAAKSSAEILDILKKA